MSKWNRSNIIALSSLMVSIVAIMASILIPEVRCFFGLPSEFCSSSSYSQQTQTPIPTPPIPTGELNLISSRGVDYRTLRKLLAEGEWQKADIETTNVLLQSTGTVKGSMWMLSKDDIHNIPCEDLHIIDKLWKEYSQKKFGLGVQKYIYMDVGGKFNYNANLWRYFGIRVGWIQNGNWLSPSQLTFSLNAPKGHLPSDMWTGCSKTLSTDCIISRRLLFHINYCQLRGR